MVHSILNEKSSLNVASVLKAEQAYHEAKALVIVSELLDFRDLQGFLPMKDS